MPDHSTYSVNRQSRFRECDVLRHVFERIVGLSVEAGLVGGKGFAVDARVIEADASRYHGVTPEELNFTKAENPPRAVRQYLSALDKAGELEPGRTPPKVISPSNTASAWTAKDNKRVQFGYGLNYLIDNEHAIIVDVEAKPPLTYDGPMTAWPPPRSCSSTPTGGSASTPPFLPCVRHRKVLRPADRQGNCIPCLGA